MNFADNVGDVPATFRTTDFQLPRLGVTDIVEVDTVDIVATRHVAAELGQIVTGKSLLRIHIAFFAHLLDKLWIACTYLFAPVSMPFPYGDGDNPCVALHPALMTLIDAELQGIVARVLPRRTRHTDIPGLHRRREDGTGSDTCLYEYSIYIGTLQLVEDVDEFLFLSIGGVRSGPVQILDCCQPYGTDLMFGCLC